MIGAQLSVFCRRLCSTKLNLIRDVNWQTLCHALVVQDIHFQSRYSVWGSRVCCYHRPPQAVEWMVGLLSQHLHLAAILLYVRLLSFGPVWATKNKRIIISLHTWEWRFHSDTSQKDSVCLYCGACDWIVNRHLPLSSFCFLEEIKRAIIDEHLIT